MGRSYNSAMTDSSLFYDRATGPFQPMRNDAVATADGNQSPGVSSLG